jgi:hypothetical protein
LKFSKCGLNEFVSSCLIEDGNSELASLEFIVLFVCSSELSRSALRFVGDVGSVMSVVFRDVFLKQNKLIMI